MVEFITSWYQFQLCSRLKTVHNQSWLYYVSKGWFYVVLSSLCFQVVCVLSSLCLSTLRLNAMPLLVLSICLTCRFRVTVSAPLSLVGPAHQLHYHLLHWNVMYFEQINLMIWFRRADFCSKDAKRYSLFSRHFDFVRNGVPFSINYLSLRSKFHISINVAILGLKSYSRYDNSISHSYTRSLHCLK